MGPFLVNKNSYFPKAMVVDETMPNWVFCASLLFNLKIWMDHVSNLIVVLSNKIYRSWSSTTSKKIYQGWESRSIENQFGYIMLLTFSIKKVKKEVNKHHTKLSKHHAAIDKGRQPNWVSLPCLTNWQGNRGSQKSALTCKGCEESGGGNQHEHELKEEERRGPSQQHHCNLSIFYSASQMSIDSINLGREMVDGPIMAIVALSMASQDDM